MKEIPFTIIDAAKQGNAEAAHQILLHYEGYISSRCLQSYTDEAGNTVSLVNGELYDKAVTALLEGIFKFQYREPPEDFTG